MRKLFAKFKNPLNFLAKKDPFEIKFHPKLNIPVKYSFNCDGVDYFQLTNDYEMPAKRFAFAQTFYSETQHKITSEGIKEFCTAIKKHLDKGELGKAHRLADELEYRTTWLFDPDTLYRFASVIYFPLTENIQDYDMNFNEAKIERFKKKGMLTHFLQLLMNGQKLLSSLSPEDLKAYLLKLDEVKESQQRLISESME